jgi:CHASE1-domain containing sensor protein
LGKFNMRMHRDASQVSLPGKPIPAPRQLQDSWPAITVAIICVTLSLCGWYVLSLREDRLAELEFRTRADNRHLVLQNGINGYLDKLVALRAFLETNDHLSRQEFLTFARYLLNGPNALRTLVWVPRVSRADREAHERLGASEVPGYRILSVRGTQLSLAPDADEYFPVFYSSTSNAPSSGVNLRDGGVRQRALEQARDGNRMVTTEAITLLRPADGSNPSGFLVILPVYGSGLPQATTEDRRNNLIGFAEGVFQPDIMIDSIIARASLPIGIDLTFYKTDAGGDERLLYFHTSRLRAAPIAAQSLSPSKMACTRRTN